MKEEKKIELPTYVCWDCGRPFLTEKQKKRDGVVTAHTGECGLCHEVKVITHIRHWNYLNEVLNVQVSDTTMLKKEI